MKLLVIGGSGLIGNHLLRTAAARGHQATGTFRKFQLPGLVPLDTSKPDDFAALLDTVNPSAVIHAAGWTWVDGCEDDPTRAMRENAGEPARLANDCAMRGIPFVYFSTSYIFDGTAGPYPENATPCPINTYGKSKLEGENGVREVAGTLALIARVICVYGSEPQAKNYACQVLRALREGRTMKIPSDQAGNPSPAMDIAAHVIHLLEHKATGTWNIAGPNPNCTRPEWTDQLVRAFGELGVQPAPGFIIESVPTADLRQKALRPLQGGLLTTKAAALGLNDTPMKTVLQPLL